MKIEPVSENGNLNTEIIQWGCKCLSSLGYTLKNKLPEHVLNTPWSYVARFETSDGYIYLKQTPGLIGLEATIIQVLHNQFHASVPKVIGHNAELNCFLMKDAGRPLREILKQQFDVTLLCKAIDQFTLLQLAVADRVNVFIDIGVPDWRLDKFPDLYRELLSQENILIEDGLSEIEISELESLLPKVSSLCEELSDYSIKQTIVQPDFNDNNTLIDDISQDITIIDLGEIVISHPFFSLATCLQQIKKHHGLTDEDGTYLQIVDACFKNYMNFCSQKHLLDAFETAQILWIIYGALCQYRLMVACGKEKLMSFQRGKLSDSLRKFITVCISTDGP
jgi:hypothetical protein